MTLDEKDILQVDATVIAGALIFLTISSLNPGLPQRLNFLIIGLITLGVITPFATSATLVVTRERAMRFGKDNKKIEKVKERYLRIALDFTIAGFLYLIAFIVIIILISLP